MTLPEEMALCCCFLVSLNLLSICISQICPHRLSPPEFVLKRNKFHSYNNRQSSVIFCGTACFHNLEIASFRLALPYNSLGPYLGKAPPWTIQHSYNRRSIISPFIRTCEPDDTQCCLTFLSSVGLTSHTVTCTDEQTNSLSGQGVVTAEKSSSPCLWGGWARPPQECRDLHASHSRTVIVKLLSALITRVYHHMLSVRGKGKISTQYCTVCKNQDVVHSADRTELQKGAVLLSHLYILYKIRNQLIKTRLMSSSIMSTKLCIQSFVLYVTTAMLEMQLWKEKHFQMN